MAVAPIASHRSVPPACALTVIRLVIQRVHGHVVLSHLLSLSLWQVSQIHAEGALSIEASPAFDPYERTEEETERDEEDHEDYLD